MVCNVHYLTGCACKEVCSLHLSFYSVLNMWHSRRKPTFRRQKRKMSFLYQKIALTSFYPMVLVALQYPIVSLSYKRSRPRSYTAEERRNQAKKSRAMFPFTSVKRSGWSDHTHIIPGSRALRWEMSQCFHLAFSQIFFIIPQYKRYYRVS